MPKKVEINPYLVLLLRRMLEYEFVKMSKEPSRQQLVCFIYDRHKSSDYQNTLFTDDAELRDSLAASIAERINSQFLKSKEFRFSYDILQHVLRELRLVGSFPTWALFESEFANSSGARVCNRKYLGRKVLTDDEYQEVISLVNMTLYKLHFARLREDRPHKHEVILNDEVEEFIIRTASAEEIKEIETLAKRVYPCPINKFDIKRPWHEKNQNIFFIYKDDYDLWGNINLLPLKQQFYQSLKTGMVYENRITADDIYSLEERDQVDCIYIEGLACTLMHVLPLFASNFRRMVATLANVENKNLTICAIGGSVEGDLLMRNCGFKRTGWAVDPKDDKSYPFLELTWKELETNMTNAHSFLPTIVVDQNRLTKLF